MITLSILDYLNASAAFQFFCDNASYWFVFLFMVIESSFIPFPSEVVVPPAAYLAVSRGDMNIYLVVLCATAGAVVGALINYVLALWIGRPIVYQFANSRLGRACLITPEKVEKAEAYFDRSSYTCNTSANIDPGRYFTYECMVISTLHDAWCHGVECNTCPDGILACNDGAL